MIVADDTALCKQLGMLLCLTMHAEGLHQQLILMPLRQRTYTSPLLHPGLENLDSI
jgi:hypothetical protein